MKKSIIQLLSNKNPAFQLKSGNVKMPNTEKFFSNQKQSTDDFERASHAISLTVLTYINNLLTPETVSLEVGGGQSTCVFASMSKKHLCINPDTTANMLIKTFMQENHLNPHDLVFIEEPSDKGLPLLEPALLVDVALIDGNHSFPIPIVDWHYIDKHLKQDGILLIDDTHIKSVKALCDFLDAEDDYLYTENIGTLRVYKKLSSERTWGWKGQKYNALVEDRDMTFEESEVRRIAKLFAHEDLIKRDLRWESFSAVFMKEIQKASLVVDCGAEYGYYIDMALKYGNHAINIIAIEPEKTRYDALCHFFAKQKNICILPYALSQTNGFITLYKTEGKSASIDESLTQWEYTEKSSFQVESRTLDSLLEGKTPDIIKMDIEGAEVFAFQGMYETLKNSSPIIFLEYHMKFVHALEPEGEQIILNILQTLGYKIYDYRGNVATLNHARVIIAKPERAQSIDFDKEGNQSNYHFAKQFSMLYSQLMEHTSQYSKIVIYGAGTMGQTVYKLLDPKKLVAMVDQNAKVLCQSHCDVQDLTFFEMTDPKQYDAILITVLGREDQIMQDLMQKYHIDAAKFLIFNLD